jgi:hypothetical protein
MRIEWQSHATPTPTARPPAAARARMWHAFVLFSASQYRWINFNHISQVNVSQIPIRYKTIHRLMLCTIEFIDLLNIIWVRPTIYPTLCICSHNSFRTYCSASIIFSYLKIRSSEPNSFEGLQSLSLEREHVSCLYSNGLFWWCGNSAR